MPGEFAPLRIDNAEPVSRRRLHDNPAFDSSHFLCAEPLQPGYFRLLIVSLDVDVDTAVVIHLLQNDRNLVTRRGKADIFRVRLIGRRGQSECFTPEGDLFGQIVTFARPQASRMSG